ncbi:MAG TPA: hypothetical protein ENN09_07325 [Planctomycetes bacterium]|nr:hypothetical protein [Planctomycetota bacterium]
MSEKTSGKAPSVCTVPGCGKPHHARGLCQKHYDDYRKKSHGPEAAAAAPPVAGGKKLCSVPGCSRFHHARGYCKMHYAKVVKNSGSGTPRPVSLTTPVVLPSPTTDPEGFAEKRLLLIRQRHRLLQKHRKKTALPEENHPS